MEEEKQIKRILVLGGSSFVGLQILQALSQKYTQNKENDQQYEIYYINRGKNYWNNAVQQIPNIKYINGNRSDKQEFGKLLHYVSRKLKMSEQNKWKSVIDMCAYKWQNIQSVYDGLKGIIEQYIFVSTDSVYDVCRPSIRGPKYEKKKFTGKIEDNLMETEGQNSIFQGQKITEECSIRFQDPKDVKAAKEDEGYGHAKLMCEEYMQNELDKSQFPFIILRFSDVIGPYDDSGRFWGYVKWICELNEQTPIPHDNETTQNLLSFVYSVDIVNIMLKLIENSSIYHTLDSEKTPLYKAFNLACQEAITLEEFLNEIYENVPVEQRACKNKLNTEKVGNAPAFFPSVECGPIDIQRATQLLGFQPTPVKQAIKDTTSFFTKINKTYQYKSEEKYADSKLQRKIKKI